MFLGSRRRPRVETLAGVLVDMQPGFIIRFHNEALLQSINVVIANQKEVIRLLARLDIPLAVLEYRGYDDTLEELMDEIVKVLRREIGEKICNDGFTNPYLEGHLRRWGTKTILFMGINANACVINTAEEALKRGFKIASSAQLMEDHRWDRGAYVPWYKKNGFYADDWRDLFSSDANARKLLAVD